MLRVCANCKDWVESSYRDAAAGAIGSCLIDGELTGEGHTCNVFDAPAKNAPKTDKQPELEQIKGECEVCPMPLQSSCSFRCASWRGMALELEKERDFYKQQAETFERVILSERMKAFSDCAELERKRDQWKQLFAALAADVGQMKQPRLLAIPS